MNPQTTTKAADQHQGAERLTAFKSSSNRSGGACDAEIRVLDAFAGPMRLPMHRSEDFIAEFNRTYRNVGMSLCEQEPAYDDAGSPSSQNGKTPDSGSAAEGSNIDRLG